MRGDVKTLFERLLSLYSGKISLLKTLSLNESDKRVYVKAKDIHRLQEAIEEDEAVYAGIDALDFEIGRVKDDACSILGIEPQFLHPNLKKSSDPLALQLIAAIDEIRLLLQQILLEHTHLLDNMHKLNADIKIDHETLMRIIEIDSFGKKEP